MRLIKRPPGSGGLRAAAPSVAEVRVDLAWLCVLSLVVRLGMAALITRPGTMDAAYYAAGAVRLAQGGGLSEPFIWNYLDQPAVIPHPGFTYWMPLPSLLAAVGAALWPQSFFALQVPGALLSALLPPMTYWLARRLALQRPLALMAGLVMLFSGFFFPYWTMPETFAPCALFGGLAFILIGARPGPEGATPQETGGRSGALWQSTWLRSLGAGILAGLAHLTRADGLLVLVVVLFGGLLHALNSRGRPPAQQSRPVDWLRRASVSGLVILAGYLLVMGPWLVRNLGAIGAPLAGAGSQTLWLQNYDDLFCYGCDLSPASYLSWGLSNIVRSKLWAIGVNLQRLLAEDCLIFLALPAIVGLYRLRRERALTLAVAYLALAFLAHSLAFTFPGPRGGFFHASAAALPALFTASAEGLDAILGYLSRRRHWNRRQARAVFVAAAVLGALGLSAYAAHGKLVAWRGADEAYLQAGRWLAQRETGQVTVMVANPPAFWYHTRQPAIAVPNGNVAQVTAAAGTYGARYVMLDANHPRALEALYTGAVASSELQPLPDEISGLRIYQLVDSTE